ncbi:MAG: (Fe-S)-binding protein [Actinomycetia bacterium]|nr:(Fe-S)-binding protein [Actinomycetes bacterium]
MVWVTDHPPKTVDLDSCVTCGLCLPVCPTFRLTGDETASPRGRLAAIAAVAQGRIEVDERFDEITSFCLQCRACETACPSMLPYGEVIEAARAEAVTQVPRSNHAIRRLALGRALRSPFVMRASTLEAAVLQRMNFLGSLPIIGGATAGLRRLPLPLPSARGGGWGPEGAERVVLFTGCVADTWFTEIHTATVRVLLAAGYRVEAPETQTCCGALASHSGFGSDADSMAHANISSLTRDAPIVVNVAGCGAHLKAYGRYGDGGEGIAARTKDVTEIVAQAIEEGRLPTFASNGQRVVVQDPCHLEHGQNITSEPRLLIEAAGYEVIDADPGGMCCGAAGLYQVDHPDTAERLGAAKAIKVEATGVSLVASANAGCEMQLRRYLDDGYEVRHPVEIYASALQTRA